MNGAFVIIPDTLVCTPFSKIYFLKYMFRNKSLMYYNNLDLYLNLLKNQRNTPTNSYQNIHCSSFEMMGMFWMLLSGNVNEMRQSAG
jgi:hypothetical protein